MTDNQIIFSETMRLVAAEIGDRGYDAAKVEELFDKYHSVVKSLYQKNKGPVVLKNAKSLKK